MKHEKGGSPTSSRSDVPKCRATAQGVGAVVDKLTTEPGECHCGSHKGCEVTLLRVVSKLVFLKPCNCFSPTSILAVFCCNRDDLIGCVHPKGILPEAFLRYHPKSPETLASRMFHSVSRSCLATPSVAVPTCQNIAGHVILGSNGRIQNWRATCWGATYWNILCLSINQALLLLSERKHGCHTRKPEHGVIRTYQGYPELVWFKHIQKPKWPREQSRSKQNVKYICYPILVGCVSLCHAVSKSWLEPFDCKHPKTGGGPQLQVHNHY